MATHTDTARAKHTERLSRQEIEAFDPHAGGTGVERRHLCPLCHGDRARDYAHRTLVVNSATDLYHCHRCGASGRLREAVEACRRQPRAVRERDRLRQAFSLPPVTISSSPPSAAIVSQQRPQAAATAVAPTTGCTAAVAGATIRCGNCWRHLPAQDLEEVAITETASKSRSWFRCRDRQECAIESDRRLLELRHEPVEPSPSAVPEIIAAWRERGADLRLSIDGAFLHLGDGWCYLPEALRRAVQRHQLAIVDFLHAVDAAVGVAISGARSLRGENTDRVRAVDSQ